jgi:hypothetical protein
MYQSARFTGLCWEDHDAWLVLFAVLSIFPLTPAPEVMLQPLAAKETMPSDRDSVTGRTLAQCARRRRLNLPGMGYVLQDSGNRTRTTALVGVPTAWPNPRQTGCISKNQSGPVYQVERVGNRFEGAERLEEFKSKHGSGEEQPRKSNQAPSC